MTSTQPDLDEASLRLAYAQFPSGVVAIAAEVDGIRVGMAVSSFVSVSIKPPLVAVCIQKTSTTWPKFERVNNIGVSVLGEAHRAAVRTLAAKTGDRFTGLDVETKPEGAIFIRGAPIWLDTTVEQEVPAGDHMIVLLRINSLAIKPDINPIIFHGSKFKKILSSATSLGPA